MIKTLVRFITALILIVPFNILKVPVLVVAWFIDGFDPNTTDLGSMY